MKLPLDLQRFPEPTLIVAADLQIAKCWLAGGDSLEAVDGVALPRERMSDEEGASVSSFDGTRRSDPSADKHDTPRKEKFTAMIADWIATLVHQGHAAKIRIAAPPEILHLVEARLPHDLRERILSRTAKDLMQYPEVTLITALLSPAK
jgi:protein required for attachment to host cells